MLGTKRLAVMAHYDRRGLVAPHVQRQIEALAADVSDVIVVSTATLTDESRRWISERVQLIERPNYGYDFFSYKVGLDARSLGDYDEVIVCNDSYVGPLRPYREIFETMSRRPVDFWGLTRCDRHAPHLQSFFVAFRPWVVGSRAFTAFWNDMVPMSDRFAVIAKYEIGMTQALAGAGFAFDAYFLESEADARLGRRRIEWWAAHRIPAPAADGDLIDFKEYCSEAWNTATVFADRCLDGGRLPFVKIDTLRYDPYGLNSDRLLRLCEAQFPEAFDGVREFLEATSTDYRDRQSLLFPTPQELVSEGHEVEYRHGR